MMGSVIGVILVIAILFYVLKTLLNETDYQSWLNILLVTVILFTVVLSIFMILNKVGNTNGQNKTSITKEQKLQEKQPNTENTANKEILKQKDIGNQKEISEMSDEELSIVIAENYLTLKREYEQQNNGADGSAYAANQIIEEYSLTQEEWDDFYKKAQQNGYFKKAADNLLNKGPDYLIKS